ncbi:MAG TPA: DNA polymerase III subunit delta [Phycisphaerales bacterium]|nr:DNA polymerase III subunit delta [Phycisphaerales bacterium]
MAKKPAASTDLKPMEECRVFIIQGKEAFLRVERTAEVRERLEKHFGGVDVFTFDGNSATAADVLDECRSFGLMSGHKLVIVEDAEELVKEDTRPLFERYAESPCEGSTLVLRSGAWRAGKLDKIVNEVGMTILCNPVSDNEAQKWVSKRAGSEHRVKIDPVAVSMLVMRVGAELGKLDTELAKLAAAAPEGLITPEIVQQFVQPTREEAVWGIQQTLLTEDANTAMQHLRYVLDVSRHPPQLVLYAFVDLARKVHAASRALHQGVSPQVIARTLKLWGASEHAILKAGNNANPARALRLLRDCVAADSRSKSGFGEVERTLERLVVRFSQLLGSHNTAQNTAGSRR